MVVPSSSVSTKLPSITCSPRVYVSGGSVVLRCVMGVVVCEVVMLSLSCDWVDAVFDPMRDCAVIATAVMVFLSDGSFIVCLCGDIKVLPHYTYIHH